MLQPSTYLLIPAQVVVECWEERRHKIIGSFLRRNVSHFVHEIMLSSCRNRGMALHRQSLSASPSIKSNNNFHDLTLNTNCKMYNKTLS
jgi:hypothetical protein